MSGDMWGFLRPPTSDPVCQFSCCTTPIAIRAHVRAWKTLVTGDSILEEDQLETWLCFEHEFQVKDAVKIGSLKIRRSVEGWLWIDNIDHLRFTA